VKSNHLHIVQLDNGSVVHIRRAEMIRDAMLSLEVYIELAFLEHQGLRMLIALDGPQDAYGTSGSGHASDAIMLGEFELLVITEQNRLVKQQS
jgi:hypothetical protein